LLFNSLDSFLGRCAVRVASEKMHFLWYVSGFLLSARSQRVSKENCPAVFPFLGSALSLKMQIPVTEPEIHLPRENRLSELEGTRLMDTPVISDPMPEPPRPP